MKDWKGSGISIDEIIQRIKEEIAQRKDLSHREADNKLRLANAQSFMLKKHTLKKIIEEILWRYGTRYARIIKKIPVLRKMAEHEYSRLAYGGRSQTRAWTSGQVNTADYDFLSKHWSYHGFLDRTRQEGLKGRVKLVVFKVFGFFAWWQAQINRALLEEITKIGETTDNNNLSLKRNIEQVSQGIKDIADMKADKETIEGLRSRMQGCEEASQQIHEVLREIRDQKLSILDEQRRLTLFLDEARRRLLAGPVSIQQIETMRKEAHMLDSLYAAFEDQFRGSRQAIKEKVRVYLPYMEQAGAGTKEFPILDVGCGRGEWLELLKEKEYVARGIDENRIMVLRCNELHLDVVEADAIEYLRTQRSNSLGAVTGFHLIEHLPWETIIALFDESLRVLRPGGIVIFEMPNPENLMVGACNFYCDPTHRKPLPPEPLKFLAEKRGFAHIEIVRLHKMEEPHYTGQKSVDDVLYRVTMEQDYSIVAKKE